MSITTIPIVTESFDNTSMPTIVTVNTKEVEKITTNGVATPSFLTNDNGNWRAQITLHWPIIMGIFFVLLVFAATIYLLYKTEPCNKVRVNREREYSRRAKS